MPKWKSECNNHSLYLRVRSPPASTPIPARRRFMENHWNVLLALALILVAGKVISHVGERIGLPTVVSMICVGLLIGPAVLGIVSEDSTLQAFAQIGVIILMFIVGLETDLETMRRVS